MFYMIVKMSSGWYGKKIHKVNADDVKAFADSGEPVVIVDDLELFTETTGVEINDIIW